jgi:hypothetical protein
VDVVEKILKCFPTAESSFETLAYSMELPVAISHSIELWDDEVSIKTTSRQQPWEEQ